MPTKTARKPAAKPAKKAVKKTAAAKPATSKPAEKKAAAPRSSTVTSNGHGPLEALSVPLTAIVPSKDNPRKDFGDVTGLALSIAEVGLLEPLVVQRAPGNKFLLVAGERRYRALKSTKAKTADVVVRGFAGKQDQLITAVVENVQRKDLTPLEEGRAFRQLIDAFELTQAAVAKRVGVSEAHVSKRLALLNLPGNVQTLLSDGKVTATEAYELSRLTDLPFAAKRIDEVLQEAEYGEDVAEQVNRELAEWQRQSARDAAADKLRTEGVHVVDRDAAKGASYPRVVKPGAGWGTDLELDVVKHRKEPCRVVVVSLSRNEKPDVVEYCTDPTRHTKKGDSDLKTVRPPAGRADGSTMSTAERDRRRAEREALQHRREFMRRLVTPPAGERELVPAPVITLLALRRYATAGWSVEAKAACELLDLEPIAQSYNPKQKDWPGTLAKFLADADEPTLLRVALAKVLAEGETHHHRLDDHIRFLTDVGYEPTDWERTQWASKLVDVALESAHQQAEELSCDVHNRLQELERPLPTGYLEVDAELKEGTTVERAVEIRAQLETMLDDLADDDGPDVVNTDDIATVDEHQAAVEEPAESADVEPAREPCSYPGCRLLAEHEEPHDLTPDLTDYMGAVSGPSEQQCRDLIAKLDGQAGPVKVLQQELYAGISFGRSRAMVKELNDLARAHPGAF